MATEKKYVPSENARKVIDYLKGMGVGVKLTTAKVQAALGFDKPGCVTGSINGFVKKGYVERTKEVLEEGQEAKSVFWLTEAGAAWNPDAE